jgi:hypothetical protein
MKVNIKATGNTKISSVAHHLRHKESQMKGANLALGCATRSTEALALMLDLASVETDTDFTEVPTVPLEERPAIQKSLVNGINTESIPLVLLQAKWLV